MLTCPNCGKLTKEQIYIYNAELRKQNFGHTPILPTCKICDAEIQNSHLCNGGNIIVLNGTCGSGKSTVAEVMLQKGFLAIDGDCALQSAKHKRNGEKVDYRELVDEIADEIDLLSLYTDNVVLATVIHPEDIDQYKKMFEKRNLNYRFILLKPQYEVVLQLCQKRTCHKSVTTEYWIDYFYKLLNFENEVEVIDNTDMTAEETAEYIIGNFCSNEDRR